ncbi:hypothetical protein CC80DRAFT_412249 [Byssothecium circinans]|uniref:Copper-fist domain-containing protein n=1 Tax=Byssothecium circinans TaxID=147558 RepID=A0A6A5TX61_9PLEO|nr:hypothetical protein CC80DRAFT_412249 [Byssothecium circinans]
MPLIDGEKYACQSCIKGHRVSGCNHHANRAPTDRELHHINPKGRPVKQCEHCRGARKAKSHHAKCDCGDKKDKDKSKDKLDATTCCCHSGAKCICGNKKEPVGLRLDTSKQTLHDVRVRPKATTTHSENNLTVFANGHHRPCHRNNNSAHVLGAPYQLPRPHTLHGQTAFSAFAQGNVYGQTDASAPRSADTQSLSNMEYYRMLGASSRVDALPLTPLSGSLDNGCFPDPLFSSRNSTFGTGTHSPAESHQSDTMGGSQWLWNSSLTSVDRNFGLESHSTSPSQDCLPILDSDWAIPSAGFAGLPNHTWSAGDLPLDTGNMSESLVQPISHSGESKQSAPGLSVASSSPSEIGEPTLFGDLDLRATSESLFWDDAPAFRPATSNVSDTCAPTSVPPRSTPEPQGLEATFPKDFSSVRATMASSDAGLYSETPAMAMPNNTDDIATNDSWLIEMANNTPFAAYMANFDPSALQDWPL